MASATSTWVFSLQTACIHYAQQMKAAEETQEIYIFTMKTLAKNFVKVLADW